MPVERNHRGWTGATDPALARGAWKCPTCQTQQTTPVEAGCPNCGAGTVEQAEAASRDRMVATVDLGLLRRLALNPEEDTAEFGLVALTPRARLTIARALAHYADFGMPSTKELNKGECLAWAREIDAGIPTEYLTI